MRPGRLARLTLAAVIALPGLAVLVADAPLWPDDTAAGTQRASCRFMGSAEGLDFGPIDPDGTASVTVITTRRFLCQGLAAGTPIVATADDGLHPAGPGVRQLRHARHPDAFMAYTVVLSPSRLEVDADRPQTLTITGSIAPSAFGPALAGVYADRVSITLLP